MVKIRCNLKELCIEKGISMLEISEKTGLNYATLHKFASNKTNSTKWEVLEKIIEVTGFKIEDLLVVEYK